jgi:hypothetical protein
MRVAMRAAWVVSWTWLACSLGCADSAHGGARVPADAGRDEQSEDSGSRSELAAIDAGERGQSRHDAAQSHAEAGAAATSSQSSQDLPSNTDSPETGRKHDGGAGGSQASAAGAPSPPAHAPTDAGSPHQAELPAKDAGTDTTPSAECVGPPGLYQDNNCQVLSEGVRAYTPRYPRWSDGAAKARFIYLPPGSHIDTTNPDRWNFPKGTRLYKTFISADGRLRVETRLIEKMGTAASLDSWTLTSYAWSRDQQSVSAASNSGVIDALGTGLDIPSQAQCHNCHLMTGLDAVNGFGAIQLNHDAAGISLADLIADGTLVNGDSGAPLNVSVAAARIPGDETAQAALGYLHGNCGHCHGGPTPRIGLELWSKVGVSELSDTPIMKTAVCQCLQNWIARTNSDSARYVLRVSPSHDAISGIIGRMSTRVTGEQMPPIGTTLIDPTGLAAVKRWIDSLDGTRCDAQPPTCSTIGR